MQVMLDMHIHVMHSCDMKLETYLTENNMTDAEFGALAGLSQSQVSRIRRGVSWPSRDAVEAITSSTGGAVTANDLFEAKSSEAAE